MPQKFRISDVRRFPSTDLARRGEFDTIITYQLVDTGQTYFITIPKDPPSESDIKEAVGKDIVKRSALIGKEFEV